MQRAITGFPAVGQFAVIPTSPPAPYSTLSLFLNPDKTPPVTPIMHTQAHTQAHTHTHAKKKKNNTHTHTITHSHTHTRLTFSFSSLPLPPPVSFSRSFSLLFCQIYEYQEQSYSCISWLLPRVRGIWENVRQFILRLHFFCLF